VGEFVYSEMRIDAEAFVRKIENKLISKHIEPLEVDLDIAGFNICGRITDLYEHGLIQIQYAKTKSKYLLNTWIYHLILHDVIEDENRIKSFLILKNAAWEFMPVSKYRDILKSLIQLYWDGMSEPLHFFPESSFEYARKIILKNQSKQDALNSGKNKWTGSDFARGESEDLYFELCFVKTDPLDQAFQQISEEVFAPLLAHCTDIVL